MSILASCTPTTASRRKAGNVHVIPNRPAKAAQAAPLTVAVVILVASEGVSPSLERNLAIRSSVVGESANPRSAMLRTDAHHAESATPAAITKTPRADRACRRCDGLLLTHFDPEPPNALIL